MAPESPDVKDAFEKISKNDSQPPLLQLCTRFLLQGDEQAAHDAIQYLQRSAAISVDAGRQCMELTMSAKRVKNVDLQDQILAGLLRESPTAKKVLAKRLQQGHGGPGTTVAFEEIYALGEGAANGITAVVLDAGAWSDEASRIDCERDVFQLYLAKLMEVGHDYDGRAMKGVARLLAADVKSLHDFIDEDVFDVIVAALDYRQPIEIKSQATLATAKYLEVAESTGQAYLTSFVAKKITRQQNEDLVLAFSAAASVFPIARPVAASLFLVEGFLTSLVPLLEKKAKSKKVEHAALEMLSAACIDGACREAIDKHCVPWLRHILDTGEDERPGLAALTLAKLASPSVQNKNDNEELPDRLDGLVSRLRGMALAKEHEDKPGSIEGLAYASSANPMVKEKLINDEEFLNDIMKDLAAGMGGPMFAFGCLNLINNLSKYIPALSEEQKKVAELKAYASASKPSSGPDPLDEEAAVSRRCKVLIDAGVVSSIVRMSKSLSPASVILVFQILLSISWPQSHRGIVAQQGGAKLLLILYTRVTSTEPESIRARQTAAQALARILTSVNPILVFPSSSHPSLVSAIRPLVSLLSDDSSSYTITASSPPRDLLPAYEALLALANILIAPPSGTVVLIIRLAFPTIESLLLHDNVTIRRSATQVVTNLVQHPPGVALFDGSVSPTSSDSASIPTDASASKVASSRRLHILLALSGSEDLETRKAAGGALAMLTECPQIINLILSLDRGPYLLVGMLEDSEPEVQVRGVVCLGNVTALAEIDGTGGTGLKELVRGKLNEQNVKLKLRGVLEGTMSNEVRSVVAEAIAFLQG